MSTTETHFYSDHDMQCPESWYGGFKEGRVIRFGDGDRTASNPWTGEWQGSTFTLLISDFDRTIRQRLDSATDRFWSLPLVIRMTTRANRAVLGTPYTVFVGPIIEAKPAAPLAFELTLGDIVSQGLLSDQHQIPWRKIGDGPLSLFDAIYEHLDLESPEPIIYGEHRRIPASAVGSPLVGDPASPEGFEYVPTYLGIRTIAIGTCHAWLVAGHALGNITDVYIVDVNGVRTSVIADEGTEWWIPHHAAYATVFGAPYEDLRSDTYGIDRRYSIIYGLVGATNPDAVAEGEATLTVWLEGIEPIGDGSGDFIRDRLLQYKHFLINFVAHYGADSYQSGEWLTNPTWSLFDGTVEIVEDATFDACSVIAFERFPMQSPHPGGYVGAAIIGANSGHRSSVKRWIAEWNISCGVQFGVNHFGQLRVFMLHPTAEAKAAAPLFTDQYEILRGSFNTDVRWQDMVNRVPFQTDYDHAAGVWRTVDFAEAVDSIQNYGRAITGDLREYAFAPGITMAYHMARLETLVRKHPPRFISFEATIGPDDNDNSLGYLDLGDYIRYQHFAAVGTAGEIRLAQIVRHQVQAGSRKVLVEAFDCEDLIGYDAFEGELVGSSSNDTCAEALEIELDETGVYTVELNTDAHTTDVSGGSPPPACGSGIFYHAAWFTYTAPSLQTGYVTTGLSEYDTVLIRYSGTCGTLVEEDCNDNDGIFQTSFLEITPSNPLLPGVTYKFLVHGYTADASGKLVFSFVVDA